MPTVSVIIPTYNRRAYVQEAIDSVLAQTYTDHEIIVIDDGSTDGTGDALRERYGDRIIYEWQENQGESVARNRGIALAQGEYVAFLDSDDLWLAEKLDRQVAYLEEHPEVGAVWSLAILVGPTGEMIPGRAPLGGGISEYDLTLEGWLGFRASPRPSRLLVRTKLVELAGGFDVETRYGEDWLFAASLSRFGRMFQIDEVLCAIREHGSNQARAISAQSLETSLEERSRAIAKFAGAMPDSSELQSLVRQAQAMQLAVAGLRALAVGLELESADWLQRSAQLAPDLQCHMPRLAHEYLSSVELGAESRLTAARSWYDAATVAARAVGAGGFCSRTYRTFVRELMATAFFKAHSASDRSALRGIWPRMVQHQPRWLLNPGVWSISAEAYVGPGVMTVLRNAVRSRRTVKQSRLDAASLSPRQNK